MNHLLFSFSLIFFTSSLNAATPAAIEATDSNSTRVTFAFDTSGVPRVSNAPARFPTIKDFREDSDYSDFCHKGDRMAVKDLLIALVEAADGDGDSYAKLVDIRMTKFSQFTVVAEISDESGVKEETYVFERCEAKPKTGR